MKHEDILYQSSIIMQEFDKELEKVDAERMLMEISQGFRRGTKTESGVEKVMFDFQTTHAQYRTLLSILAKLYVNFDDILGCFPMAHRILSTEIPKEWLIQLGDNALNNENYIIFRLGGIPNKFLNNPHQFLSDVSDDD